MTEELLKHNKKAKHNEVCRVYRENNRNIVKARNREWARNYRLNNKEKYLEYARNWYRNNKKKTEYKKRGKKVGYKVSDLTKSKISTKNKISVKRFFENGGVPYNKGKKLPNMSGSNHWRWIEDRTKLQKYNDSNKDRRSGSYNYWRKQVWLRDNFKCKIANPDCNGRLEAHHILGFTLYPELRYDINNGITLCHFHHPRKKEDEKKLSPYFQQLVAEMK